MKYHKQKQKQEQEQKCIMHLSGDEWIQLSM